MRRNSIFTGVIILCLLATFGRADDLYHVTVTSEADAELLNSIEVEPVLCLHDGYLILMEPAQEKLLRRFEGELRPLVKDLQFDEIGVLRNTKTQTRALEDAFYQNGHIALVRIPKSTSIKALTESGLIKIERAPKDITYSPDQSFFSGCKFPTDEFDSLITLVLQDSVEAYLYRLEAYYRRLTGTDSCYAARDWIEAKFLSFGYDSVYTDNFTGSQLWDYLPVSSDNVVATKVGSVYPDKHIIIGGHFDAVPDCPGVDDNGTGTTGVLEIARVMADIETEKTIVFIAFDSEESWMWGSYHYANEAVARGDDIEYMMNIDMIGHLPNDTEADLYSGAVTAYSALWADLATEYVGIYGYLSGSTASDHLPFQEYGIPVTFVQERIFSSEYHQPSDSTSYINFEYMTRMIKASLLTTVAVDRSLPSVQITEARDAGTGDALQIAWEALSPTSITHYQLFYYPTGQPELETSVSIDNTVSNYMLTGLTTLQQYTFYIIAYNSDLGTSSISYNTIAGTPRYYPLLPAGQSALPIKGGIFLSWVDNNSELDFSHYAIIRDGILLPDPLFVLTYTDDDPSLGTDIHEYYIVAVDTDDNLSDTTGAGALVSKAAMLQSGRVLAINRSYPSAAYLVDHEETGEFLSQALINYDVDFVQDTISSTDDDECTGLMEFIDYELVVIGAESARRDDIGEPAHTGGLLPYLAHYMSIGGKVVIFGRWGDLGIGLYQHYFDMDMPEYFYADRFDMDYRTKVLSTFQAGFFSTDFIGAQSQDMYFPELRWDSLLTLQHTGISADVEGVPCPSFAGTNRSPVYTYDSRTDDMQTEGKTVAWSNSNYLFFEFPLSMMERLPAKLALNMAAKTMMYYDRTGFINSGDDLYISDIPETIVMKLSIPAIHGYVDDVDIPTLLINNTFAPDSAHVEFLTSWHLIMFISGSQLAATYDALPDWNYYPINATFEFNGENVIQTAFGNIRLNGDLLLIGDTNGDGEINLGDAVYLVDYIFRDGPAPVPEESGDANCDGRSNIGDIVYIINYIYKGGDAPGCY